MYKSWWLEIEKQRKANFWNLSRNFLSFVRHLLVMDELEDVSNLFSENRILTTRLRRWEIQVKDGVDRFNFPEARALIEIYGQSTRLLTSGTFFMYAILRIACNVFKFHFFSNEIRLSRLRPWPSKQIRKSLRKIFIVNVYLIKKKCMALWMPP